MAVYVTDRSADRVVDSHTGGRTVSSSDDDSHVGQVGAAGSGAASDVLRMVLSHGRVVNIRDASADHRVSATGAGSMSTPASSYVCARLARFVRTLG